MLDNEPTGGERDGATPPPGDAAESTTPARRTRAPRRKATPPAPPEAAPGTVDPVSRPDGSAAGTPGAEPAAAIEAASAADAAAEAPAAPARRRRKAAAPAAQPALTSADAVTETGGTSAAKDGGPAAEVSGIGGPNAEASGGPGAAAEVSGAGEREPVPPVKATRSRRKKAAPAAVTGTRDTEPAPAEPPAVADQPAAGAPIAVVIPLDDEPVVEEESAGVRGRRSAPLPPAVLFMPPEATEAPPTRRGRRVTATAAAAVPETAEATAAPAAQDEPVEGSRRSRRRRRGGASEEPVEAVETPVEVVEPAPDEADESADDDEDGTDEDLDEEDTAGRRRRRRGRRGRGRGKGPADEGGEEAEADTETAPEGEDEESDEGEGDGITRRRRRRRRKGSGEVDTGGIEEGVHTVVRVREPRRTDEVQGVSGSTRLEAKRQRRRDGREQRRTRPPILSESEFLARREAVDRVMVVRQKLDRTQIAVLEDGILVEHYVARATSGTMVGNVYLGKVQNVLPSMEAAFVDMGRGRNAVLYAGEVNWDATGLEGRARSIEQALRSGDPVLVQVTKDPIGHKGARLTSHIALSGRHLVYVPHGNASGISRKLPDTERRRLRDILKKLVPDGAGVIVRTAAEGASEDDLARDVKRLQAQWEDIQAKAASGHAPTALSEEPDLVIRVVRDLFNEDFRELVVQGDQAYGEVENYLNSVSPDLVERLRRHTGSTDVFAERRIDEQILKGLDRKVFLPSGGHLVIDRTEAMTVVDVNTGKYTGAGGNLEETVTRNNLEAAEEIVRQLRLRDLGGIVVIDFIDMVLESNRELVLRRLTECLGRDRTKHQVTEITSLGLVQMTRKRIGAGLLEAFSETCEHCKGRGLLIHTEPVPERRAASQVKAVAAAARTEPAPAGRSRRRRGDNAPEETVEPVAEATGPAAVAAEVPPVAGSGIVAQVTSQVTTSDPDDDYDIGGYDLSRYEPDDTADLNGSEPLRLAGADDPDAADDEIGAGRRRSRRGARRRTRP